MTPCVHPKLVAILCDILDLEPDQIRPDLHCDEVESWDLLNSLRIVTAVEETFQVRLAMSEIQEIHSVGDLNALLQAHGALDAAA